MCVHVLQYLRADLPLYCKEGADVVNEQNCKQFLTDYYDQLREALKKQETNIDYNKVTLITCMLVLFSYSIRAMIQHTNPV